MSYGSRNGSPVLLGQRTGELSFRRRCYASFMLEGRNEVGSVHVVDDCDNRYCQEDADDAEHVAAYYNAHEYPETGYAELVSEEVGLDEIAVKNLEYKRDYDEDQCVERVGHEENQGSDYGTDQRSECGYEIRDGNYKGYQADILHAEDGHEYTV